MIVIKIYENYWSNVIIHQQYLKQQVTIIDDLASFSEARFSVEGFDISKYNKVEIYEAGNPDILKFKGFVNEVNKKATIFHESCEIVCWSGKGLLQKRGPLYGYQEVSTPMNIVIPKMMNHWNDIGDNRAYQIDFSDPIDMEYNLGSTCYNIIQELADQKKAYRTVVDNKIVVSSIIGVDKTIGSGYTEFFFNKTSASNVKEVYEVQSEDRSSVAIGIANDGSKLMVYDNEPYPFGVIVENFQTGDLSQKTNSLLDRNNVDKRSISVVLDETKKFNVNVGDKVVLKIEGLKTISDFNGSVFVTNKETTYKFGKKYEVIQVGEVVSTMSTLSSLIKNINDKIDKIRNK